MAESDTQNKFSILITEDNLATQLLLKKTLSKEGYDVHTASNGKEAMKLFQKNRFRIVLTDWMMPEMTGIELCKEIRKNDSDGYVFIILLTANDKKDDIIRGLMAGADDYLTKPINHAELIARLNTGRRILSLEESLKSAIKDIEMLSKTDPLTGCYNRGYLMENLEYEIKRAVRYKRPFSVVFCDIDHFKKVNDTYGHQVGDRTLIEFVQCIMKNIRIDLDWLTRYGGEEFLLVLPETHFEGAKIFTERLREKINNLEIKIHDSILQITSSFGVVTYDPDTSGTNVACDDIINLTDKFLYQSKADGRDRINAGILQPENVIK